MKKSLLLALLFLLFQFNTHAQKRFGGLGKRLGDAAEEAVTRRLERETQKKTDKAMDEVFEEDEDQKSKKSKKSKSKKASSGLPIPGMKETSASDFQPGSSIVYEDHFSRDAIGDFPVTWNTNTGAEVVTLNGDNNKWLKLSEKGTVTPMNLKNIPDNSTIEFDLAASEDYNFYQSGLYIMLSNCPKSSDAFKWQQYTQGKDGIKIRLHPRDEHSDDNAGRTEMCIYQNGKKIGENRKQQGMFSYNNNHVHVGMWRQGTRLRVYIDGQKVWDLPRAFTEGLNYNNLSFYNGNDKGNILYISNLRVAKAGADNRHALLETGTFTTSDILFDIGKSSIKSSSYSTIDEVGEVMAANPTKHLEIIGYTDSDGDANSNKALSEKRAQAVKAYLVKNFNLPSSNIQTVGMGEENPVASNETTSGKKQNRRVEFNLR